MVICYLNANIIYEIDTMINIIDLITQAFIDHITIIQEKKIFLDRYGTIFCCLVKRFNDKEFSTKIITNFEESVNP